MKRVGLWKLAQVLSLAVVKHLGMPYKPWMGNDYVTADALLEDILRGGNFGSRDKSMGYEGLFISDQQSLDVSKSRVSQVIRSMNAIVRRRWKAAEKCPLLYPIGWLCLFGRYLQKRITGQRKTTIVRVFRQSGKRRRLYKSLNMFEPEK